MTYIHRTAKFLKIPFWPEIQAKVEKALPYFPELDIVILGSTTTAPACANSQCSVVRFNIENGVPSYVTIFHELGHLIADPEFCSEMPSGERACTIYAMARIPPELIDEDRLPYLRPPKCPKEMIPVICRDAIQKREAGLRNYIQYAEKRMSQAGE